MKAEYIDLMEKVFSAYTNDKMDSYIKRTKECGLSEHGFPRLTSNLGILIAHGRKSELKDRFIEMMDICCNEIPTALGRKNSNVGNDFSVKEIVFCLLEIEKANIVDKETTDRWRQNLKSIIPKETCSVISPVPVERVGNWAAFGAASEQARKYAGIGSEDDFIENQIKSQLLSFDSNGMYRDPGEPMVYDFVTRLQLAVAMHFGYNGESYKELENCMLKSADITLMMQSVSGEIPYGGQGYGVGSSWSRGQAWGVYGFTLSYIHTKEERYLDTAKQIADYFIAACCDDYLPKSDFRSPSEPVLYDSSAGLIAACGLIELSKVVSEYERDMYYNAALRFIKAIVDNFADWSDETDAIITHCSEAYEKQKHLTLIYADFFLIEAIKKLKGYNTFLW